MGDMKNRMVFVYALYQFNIFSNHNLVTKEKWKWLPCIILKPETSFSIIKWIHPSSTHCKMAHASCYLINNNGMATQKWLIYYGYSSYSKFSYIAASLCSLNLCGVCPVLFSLSKQIPGGHLFRRTKYLPLTEFNLPVRHYGLKGPLHNCTSHSANGCILSGKVLISVRSLGLQGCFVSSLRSSLQTGCQSSGGSGHILQAKIWAQETLTCTNCFLSQQCNRHYLTFTRGAQAHHSDATVTPHGAVHMRTHLAWGKTFHWANYKLRNIGKIPMNAQWYDHCTGCKIQQQCYPKIATNTHLIQCWLLDSWLSKK